MGNVTVSINYAGVGKLLKSKEIKEELESQAQKIKAKCGDGYVSYSKIMGNRQVAFVRASSTKAKIDNTLNNTLIKSLG